MFAYSNCLSLIIAVVLSCSTVLAQQKTESKTITLEQSAKSVVTLLDKGEFAKVTNTFDAAMLKAMPADELKKAWEKIVAQAGAYKDQLGVRRETSGQFEIVYVTCEFAKAKLDAKFVFDQEGKIAGLIISPTQKPAPTGAEVIWEGKLKIGPTELRLVFHLFKQKDGTYAGTMDSPDQGASGIALDEVSVKADSVRMEVKSANIVFEGKREKDEPKIVGQFKQGGQSFPLTLTRSANATKQPQEPKPTAPPAKP